jgi:hypothetical protein
MYSQQRNCAIPPNCWAFSFKKDTDPVVVREFHPKEGAKKVLRWTAAKSIATFALVLSIFLLLPVLIIE